jgi:outer membrane receptor protein involved in Fe transport
LSGYSKFNAALLGAVSYLVFVSPAFAQGDTPVETVTVTGSRVITDVTRSPTPLTLVTADELAASTPTNIPDALNKLPVLFGNRTQRNVQNGSSNGAGNVLNLRDFGTQRTLVLLDGHRVAASNSDGSVDIDVLPQMLMTRVDVVTGGASAVYGSDAVAGVVNFILDKNFDGIKYNVSGGISKYSDAAHHQIGVAFGSDVFGDRGHFEGSLRYYHMDGVRNTARPYEYGNNTWLLTGAGTTANPYVSTPYAREYFRAMNGLVGCGSTCPATGMTFTGQGQLIPTIPGTPTGTPNVNSGGDGGYNNVTSFQASLSTSEAFGRFSYSLNDATNAYIQAGFAESTNTHFWSPVSLFTSTGRPEWVYTNNVFLSPAAQLALNTNNSMTWVVPAGTASAALYLNGNPAYPIADGNPRYFNDPGYQFNTIGGVSAAQLGASYRSLSTDRHLSLTAGLDGTVFEHYNWDFYYTHGESRQKESNPNNTNDAKLMAAMDAVAGPSGTAVCHVSLTLYADLYPGCVPLNLYSSTGPSLDAFRYISQETHYIQTNILDDVGGGVSGPVLDLPAGPVIASLSAEMRWMQFDIQSNAVPTDVVDCTGLRLCTPGATPLWTQNTAASVAADNNVYEFATEINVPLLNGVPLIQELSADIAGRYTDYSTSGSVETWKAGLDYHVDDNVRFRATMSVDIRAPNLNELFQPLLISSAGLNDVKVSGLSSSAPSHSQGNSALTPEIGHTYTAGVVLTPAFVPGLTMSVDYYRIILSHAIQNIGWGSSAVQNICVATAPNYSSPYCSLAVRPYPVGDPNYNTPANYPLYTVTEPFNTAKLRTEGLDFEIDYGFDMEDLIGVEGTVNVRELLSLQPYINTLALPNAPATFTPMPKGRMTTFLSYNIGNWGINLQNTWLSGYAQANSPVTATNQVYAQPRLNSFDVLDVTLDRKFDFAGGTADAYISVQNVGNTQPPVAPSGSTNPGLYYPASRYESAMGRYFTIGIRGNL